MGGSDEQGEEQSDQGDGRGAQGLVVDDEPGGQGGPEDARVVGERVPEGANGRGKDVASQHGQDLLRQSRSASQSRTTPAGQAIEDAERRAS